MTATSIRRASRDGGYSLLELVVALALLALLMALLPSTIRIAKRAYYFGIQLSGSSVTAVSMVTVERLLREALPQFESDESGALKIAFEGQKTALSFVAPMSEGPTGPCVCRVFVSAVQDPTSSGISIVLRSEPWAPASPSRGDVRSGIATQRALTIAAGDVAFRYFGVGSGNSAPQWHDAWPRKDRLPDLVQIDLPRAVMSRGWRSPIVVELMLRRQQ